MTVYKECFRMLCGSPVISIDKWDVISAVTANCIKVISRGKTSKERYAIARRCVVRYAYEYRVRMSDKDILYAVRVVVNKT